MEKFSLIEVTRTSWYLTLTQRSLWRFAFLMALPVALALVFLMTPQPLTDTEVQALVERHFLIVCFLLFWYGVATLFGKSNIITHLHVATRPPQPHNSPAPSPFGSFRKALSLDLFIFSLFILVCAIISFPLAYSSTAGTPPASLLLLSQSTIIALLAFGYFWREFAYFYFLLTPLPLKTSFEASYNLILRFRATCLLFGLFFLGLLLLFTFSFNLVMLGIDLFLTSWHFPLKHTVTFLVILVVLTWYEVFRQTLWFVFFQRLATPAQKQSVPAADLKNESAPETPLA